MALSRLQQIFLAEEATEGTAATLFTAANGNYLVIDPTLEFDVPYYERNIKRGTLTPLQGLTGIQQGMMKFRLELTGAAVGSPPNLTKPQWGLPLRACGFRQEDVNKLTIGAITGGPFKHGELITQTTSGATGTCVADTYNGQTVLWVAKNNGLGNATAFTTTVAHALTGGTSGATAAVPTAIDLNAGIGWWPFSYALTKIVMGTTLANNVADGDMLRGVTSLSLWQAYGTYTGAADTIMYLRRISGHFSGTEAIDNLTAGNSANDSGTIAETQFQIPTLTAGMTKDGVRESLKFSRGTVSMAGTIGEPLMLDFEFKGAKNAITDGGNVSGITFNQAVPPVLLDADLGLGHSATTFASEYVPCIRSFSLAMNNDVQFGECMSDATGLTVTNLTGRKPSGSFDPELLPEAVFAFMGDFTGNTSFRSRFTVGSVLGNKVLMTMPGLSITTAPTGDRNGLAIRTINYNLHGGGQTVSATSSDNELVLVAQYA